MLCLLWAVYHIQFCLYHRIHHNVKIIGDAGLTCITYLPVRLIFKSGACYSKGDITMLRNMLMMAMK